VDASIDDLLPLLDHGDIVIDGGNSTSSTTSGGPRRCLRRAFTNADVGTSGGVWGLETRLLHDDRR
jgi:6-phosphogluconate dehydrogenase